MSREATMYTIGRFAALAGLTQRALRLYDGLGLLRARRDPDNDYRYYTDADLLKARRIGLLRTLGFSLADIADLLAVLDDRGETRRLVDAFRAQLDRLREERLALARREEALRQLLGLFAASEDLAADLSRVAELRPDQRRDMMHTLQLQSAKLSARGPRTANEDRAWVQRTDTGGLYVVADGCGPDDRGSEASQLACEAVAEHLDPAALTADRWARHLTEAVELANARVRALRTGEEVLGTTLTALVVHDGVAHVVHVGDTRVYRHEPGRLVRLTHDHTVVQRLRDAGELDAAGARVHPQRHILTEMVGAGDALGEVSVHREEIPAGARYLLVSDGITRALDDARILEILDAEPDPDRAVRALVAAAEADSDDNATAIVVVPR